METIILATDYSKPAHVAMEYAAGLAHSMKAKLILFNAFQPMTPSSPSPQRFGEVDVQLEINRRYLEKIATDLQQDFGIAVECSITRLSLLDGLEQMVRDAKAEMVVMGIKARMLGKKIFGNSTTAVINRAEYPVLVVPENIKGTRISTILFACDYNSIGVQHRLQLIADLAMAAGARVELLHIQKSKKAPLLANSQQMQKLPAMEEIFSNVQHAYHTLEEKTVADGLKQGIIGYKADLLVMVPKTDHYWDAFFSRSKTRQMIFKISIPLLVLPNIHLGNSHNETADGTSLEIVF